MIEDVQVSCATPRGCEDFYISCVSVSMFDTCFLDFHVTLFLPYFSSDVFI